MNIIINKIQKRLVTFGLAVFFSALFGVLLAPEANAQYRRGVVWRTETSNITRIAEAQGRSDGLRDGASAMRDRKRFNPYGESKYRKGTNGYKSRFGSKAVYKRVYQQAFVRGYGEAYYRNPRGVRQSRRGW